MKLSLSLTVLSWIAFFPTKGLGVPTWPAPIDELEDIMFLNAGFRKSGFADAVTPCSYSAAGPGRMTAAEWLRTAFHDMATANVYFGTGGLDASLMFETNREENIGAAFNSSLAFFANFFSSRVSVSDLIALSVYTSVRSCGGPAVAIRAGRVDAKIAGDIGVPEPQDSLGTFENQFGRAGFTTSDMIEMTACGHTIGGVHSADFPEIVPVGSAPPNDFVSMDSTIDVFDNKIAVEWIAGNTADPMSVGPSIASGRNSDFKVFGADGNITMQALTNPTTFATTCASILQRMIETVPPGTTFSDALQPYEVKPSNLQLTLLSGGASIKFEGFIRVRTTHRSAASIASVNLVYKDRNGGNACGACTISTTAAGTTTGFDDGFVFYAFFATLPSDTSISSFNVLITTTNGPTDTFDNNGAGFPVQDSVMLLSPQSCLSNGNLKVFAAVRNDRVALPVSLDLSLKVPRQGAIVPAISTSSVAMAQGAAVGPYNIYSASYTLTSSQYTTTRFDITSGSGVTKLADTFKSTGDLGATCAAPLSGSSSSSSSSTTSSVSSSSSTQSSSISGTISSTSSSTSTTTGNTSSSSVTTSKSSSSSTVTTSTSVGSSKSSSSSTVTTSSTGTTSESSISSTVTTSSSVSSSKSSSSSTGTTSSTVTSSNPHSNSTMTTSSSVSSSKPYSNSIVTSSSTTSESSTTASLTTSDSSTSHSSGSGNILTITISSTVTVSSCSTPTPVIKPTVGSYKYSGCFTEGNGGRALSEKSTSSDCMTLEDCASWCIGYTHFGLENGRECYCGNEFNAGAAVTVESDCSMPCAGDDSEYCGAGHRLSAYCLN